jgi:hypothetical protein
LTVADELSRLTFLLAVAKALRRAGSWGGETHVQKASFLFAKLFDRNPGWDFVLYKHGPYSFDLHDDLVTAKALGLLEQRPQPPYGPSLEVTEGGDRLLGQRSEELGPSADELRFVAEKIGTKNIFELEQLATAVMLRDQGGDSATDFAAELRKVKPHVSETDAEKAISDAEALAVEARRLEGAA